LAKSKYLHYNQGMKAISIKLPTPMFEDLARRAQQLSASQSDIVRTALAAYFDQDQTQANSAAQMASRWVGIGEGAKDLASNPKHLKGFGQ
jgi:metal-responsive CopG/Arc/MetJ family transcriptional regulator